MLIITRKVGEKVLVGETIKVSIADIDGKQVKLAIDAPKDVEILRAEIAKKIADKSKKAVLKE